jgi:hypothetical protein
MVRFLILNLSLIILVSDLIPYISFAALDYCATIFYCPNTRTSMSLCLITKIEAANSLAAFLKDIGVFDSSNHQETLSQYFPEIQSMS